MKLRLIISSLALALVASPLIRAQDSAAPAAPAAPAASAAAPSSEDKTDLDKQMDTISKAMRKLKKQLPDATQNDSSLTLIGQMIDGAKGSLTMTPAKAADLPDDQKAKFVADYKAGIQGLVDKLTALQDLVKAGKTDEAVATLADIGKYEGKEHKEFRKEKPKS